MAILQVNVRPAERNRRLTRSQGGEKESQFVPSIDNYAALLNTDTTPFNNGSHSEFRTDPHSPADPESATPNHSMAENPFAGDQQIVWTLTPSTTVGRAIVSASQRLYEAGCSSARLDAQIILAHVLDKNRSWLFAHHDYELSDREAEEYTELIARRARREPVAYLIGRKEFYGLEFQVDQRVLIPRPETELLVDGVLGQINGRAKAKLVVADVGTGSGAIAISVAVNAPNSRVYGLDVSEDALAVARQNAEKLDDRDQVTLLRSDLLSALPEPADLIVANLPYIASKEYTQLDPDIRDYEPRLALEAGSEGLDAIDRLLAQASDYLKPDGAVLLEIGHDQAKAVEKRAHEMVPKPSYVGLRRDYSGHVRMVTLEF